MLVVTPPAARTLSAQQIAELRARDEMLVVIADANVDDALRDAAD